MPQNSTPETIYGELFEAVQTSHVFTDSKTFVDAIPKSEPDLILESFHENRQKKGFELASFVATHFDLLRSEETSLATTADRPVRDYVELVWDVLTRAADSPQRHSSLLPLPNPYVVPGGRFREIYYWDSYFTMLGLAASGRVALIQAMVDNFAFLIDRLGFIPNGNRTYYCTRSQPPLFVLMVELLAKVQQDQNIVVRYLPQMEKEYQFWMAGSEDCGDHGIERRVLSVNGGLLNRYWDDANTPRAESYAEDLRLAASSGRDTAEVFRDIRAACESGWDFSTRWLQDGSLASIRTSQIVPVDLNAILYKLESVLAHGFSLSDRPERANHYQVRADDRKRIVQSQFFDDDEGFFVDLTLSDWQPTGTLTLAGAYPLFFGIATPAQAARCAEKIQSHFLKAGGWVTTLNNSGQQWDAPNGWAPLQWIVYLGLSNYGFLAEARAGSRRWVDNVEAVYRRSGKLLEKYNVEEIGLVATGGEYSVQDGFGWTNGVLLHFLNDLGPNRD